MDIREIKENKLKTIFRFSVPSIIAMLLQTAITITDGYFTGNYVGENALAAINLGLPILYFYLGVGLCVGVGGTVICGRLLGAEEKNKASEVFSQTLVTAGVICILTSIAVFLLFSPILKVLRADGELSGFQYAGMFGCGNSVAYMVSAGFRFYTVTFLFMGYDVINSMYFTSCGDALSSVLISSLRGIILLLGFTFLFSALWGMTGVWLAAPITEVLTTMVSAGLITKHKKMLESR